MSGLITLSIDQKEALIKVAREAIKGNLGYESHIPVLKDDIFKEECGLFVTLYKKENLRGCIGQITSNTPLAALTEEMALHAAFHDSRFSPLSKDEYGDLVIKISVLTPPKDVEFDEIEVGRDGVVLRKDGRSSVFLPNVAVEQGWNKIDMMERLCQKAGLDKDAWLEGAKFEAFQSIEFGEE